MLKQIFLRILSAIPVLIGVSIIFFTILQLTPGGPEAAMVGDYFSPEQMAQIRRNLGLDQPVHVQYFQWLSSAVRGDLGYSFKYRQPVLEVIFDRLGATLQMTVAALILAVVVAVPVAVISAVRQYSLLDNIVTLITFFSISAPGFWLGMMLIVLFAGRLGWFPPSGIVGVGDEDSPLSRLHHAVLPTVALATAFIAQYVRFIRSGLLEVLKEDYIQTARAKGLPELAVLVRHSLRNAMLAPITLIGLSFGLLVSGSVTIETVFAWPGLGRLAVSAVLDRDYPVILGLGLMVAFISIVGNLFADIMYVWADPRIRID